MTKCTFHACDVCEFISKDPVYYLSDEDEKKRYLLHENTIENAGYVKMFEDFIDAVIEPYKDTIHTILDFGCGPEPVLAEVLTGRGFTVDHYDPFFYPQLNKDKTYDAVVSTEVIEHLKDPLETFRKMIVHIEPCGYLACMTNFRPLDDEKFLGWWYHEDPTHISFYSKKTFNVIAKKIGSSGMRCLANNYVMFSNK